MTQQWTFEKLAMATKPVLEEVLIQGTAPNPAQLNGLSYCGYNHEPIGKLTGVKFKKGFFGHNGITNGFNEQVKQDGSQFRGTWLTKPESHMGIFRVSRIGEKASPEFKAYRHLALFDYAINQRSWHQGYFKLIRDIVALPNPGDHSLLLGKAYLQFSKSFNIFCCYFILGHPEPIPYSAAVAPMEKHASEPFAKHQRVERSLPQAIPALRPHCANCGNCLNVKCSNKAIWQ